MSLLSAESLEKIRVCTKNETAYQELVTLIQEREAEFSQQIDDLDRQVMNTLNVIEEFVLLNNVSWLLMNAQNLEQLLRAFANPLMNAEPCGALLLFSYLDNEHNPREVEVMASLQSDSKLDLPEIGMRHTSDTISLLDTVKNESSAITIIEDCHTLPASSPDKNLLLQMNIQSLIGIPMFLPETNLLAVVLLVWAQPRPFREGEERFYELLSRQMATRIANYRLMQRLEARTEETVRLLANLPVGILLLDAQGRILQSNQTLRHISGYTEAELSGRRAGNLLETHDLSDLEEKLSFSEQYVFEDRFLRRDGSHVSVAVRISEVPAANGDFGGWLASLEDITARKESQEQLQEYTARLRALFDSSPQAVFLLDPEYSILAYNRVAREQIWKEARKRIQLGKSVLNYTQGYEVEGFKRNFQRCLQGEEIHEESQLHLPDGRIKWFEFNFLPIRTEDETVMGVAFTTLNITERKEDEGKLRASEARNQALVNGIPDQIFIFNHDSVFTDYHVSSAVRKYASPESLLGKLVHMVMPDGVGDRLEQAFIKAREKGAIQFLEYRDAEGRYFDTRVLPYDDNHLMAIVRDVTEAKQAEQSLRESEQQLRQITENIHQVFNIRDFETNRMLYVSPAYEKIWGRPVSDLYQNALSYVSSVHPDDQSSVLAAVRRENEEGIPMNVEFRIVRPNEEMRYISTRNFLLRDEDGEVYRVVGIAEDITERVEAEQKQLELILERERVHILSDFIEAASHEFRTPLSIVNTKLYLLERTKDQAKWKPHIAEIRQQLADILTLIESLVTMTRLGQELATQVSVNASSLVDALCRRVYHDVAAKSLTLNHVRQDDGPIILCNPEEIHEAFHHILMNAIRYTPEHGTINVREYIQNNHEVVIEFQDTGIGMTPEEQIHIFESFFRADRARTTRGFGLGLPIAQKIIERHGGRIDVKSRKDVGSVFRVILPMPQ